MTPQQQRRLEKVEQMLNMLVGSDRYIMQKNLQLLDGRNIQLGRGTGTQIGTANDQLLGFWGTTPVNQPAAIADLAAGGGDSDGVARTGVNTILARLRESGLIDT